MKMTNVVMVLLLVSICLHSQERDQDMDGVPDSIDQCQETPFLNEVDQFGCTTKKLIFPQERESGSLEIVTGYGYNINDDDINQNIQHSGRVQLNYYLKNWIYSLRTGYFTGSGDSGMQDTTLKIKRRFKLQHNFKISLSATAKLPTYNFSGNQTDFTLYASAVYYPVSSLSFFAGTSHTFIHDQEIVEELQDTNAFYTGIGYFFTQGFYANIAYSYNESKFVINPSIKSLSTTLFYQINSKWFLSSTYSHEVITDRKHDTFNISVGYSIW